MIKELKSVSAIEGEAIEKLETSLTDNPSDPAFESSELRKTIEDLVNINKELVAFNYMSSHQLKEPLRKIQFFADEILQTEIRHLSPRGKESFNRMNNAAKRMQALIADLLEFSKAGFKETTLERVNLHSIINNSLATRAEIIKEKNATVIEEGNLDEVRVNSFQFQQVMTVLLGNALKFSKADTPPIIHISGTNGNGVEFISENPGELLGNLSATTRYYKLSVKDNGIGFESMFKDKIFEPFVQLHSTKDYPGNGIGLAIVKKVIDNHRGLITANSNLGEGATFNIYIPV